ncbi:type VI secretion system protein TssA [Noviherbaspirillum aerium]|uniref:type VI secretion system protein TssA n=1 Tax=Noviherbaspirillum aerium TaxID=2588497 RepID=UPI00124BDEBB|nr:type VI secretion system protein TssA [Noviherbaspirillum aerium]
MDESLMDASVIELMSPVSDEKPCGEDFSFSPEFDRIHEARREDDPTLDYGEWESALKQADWKAVVTECQALLGAKTKDMRVAAWLTEGLIKTEGFAGLRRGLEINIGLLEKFGAHIHPRGEDGDDERRVGTTSWFIQRAAYLIRCVPLTDGGTGRFSLMDYENAVNLQLQLQRHPDSVPDLQERVTLERFANAVSATEHRYFSEQMEIIDHCEKLVQAFAGHLGEILGDAAPSIKSLAESVDAVQARIHAIGKSLGLGKTYDDEEMSLEHGHTASLNTNDKSAGVARSVPDVLPPVRDGLASGRIGSRNEAVEALRQVAAYFRNAEPHSPVAYLAEKALHWSAMPLHLWLRSVVKDQGVLSHLEEMLGAEDDRNSTGA